MNLRRKLLIVLGAGALAAPLAAYAQLPAKVVRIGVAMSGSTWSQKYRVDAFREGLRELGYVEGKNVVFDYRYAEGRPDRYADTAAELVRLKPDVIVVSSTGLAAALKQATKTIPIVVGNAGDLVATGVVTSLARPGGNVTGSTDMAPDLAGKRLEVLREVVPKAARIGVVWYPMRGFSDEQELKQIETAARRSHINVHPVAVRDPGEFQDAYDAMSRQQTDAVIIIQGGFTFFHHKHLSELAAKYRLPCMGEEAAWVENGCLVSYGPDKAHSWRRAAVFVDKILKGAKPGDLPVEQPTKFELVINMKTAKALGIKIPNSVLVRADRVIE